MDAGASPFDSAVQEEIRARIEEELRQVPEPYRTALVLRDIEELSYEEIAQVLQVSLGTVKSRLMRGREALRKRLEPHIRDLSLDFSQNDAGRKQYPGNAETAGARP